MRMRGIILLGIGLFLPRCRGGIVLGEHAEAVEGPAEFADGTLTPQRFYEDYVRGMEPVVIRGGVTRDAGFTKWTDEYLTEKYGNLTVKIEKKREEDGLQGMPGRIELAEYFKKMQSYAYVVSQLPTPMAHEASILSCMACGPVAKKFVEANLWISNGDTHSIIHKDSNNQMNCLYNGTKQWLLFDPQFIRDIPMARESEEDDPAWASSGFTQIKASDVDLKKFPRFKRVPFQRALLKAGDCIYVPGGYLHQVHSTGERNVQVSMLFSGPHIANSVPRAGGPAAIAKAVAAKPAFEAFPEHHLIVPCTPTASGGIGDGADAQAVLVRDADVAWDYVGSGFMTMGFMNTNHFQHQIEEQMFDGGTSQQVTRAHFLDAYKGMLTAMLGKTDSPTIVRDDLSMTLDALSMLFPGRNTPESWDIKLPPGSSQFTIPNVRKQMLEASMARAKNFFDSVADPNDTGVLTLSDFRALRSKVLADGLVGNFVVDQVTSNYGEVNGMFDGGDDEGGGQGAEGEEGEEDEEEEERKDEDDEEDENEKAHARDEL